MNIEKINLEALQAAERSLNELLNGGFSGLGCIPRHFTNTRDTAEAALSLVRLAIANASGQRLRDRSVQLDGRE